MKRKLSSKWCLSIGFTLALLALAWLVGIVLAQGPDEPPPLTSPVGGPGPTDAFTYQGRLMDGGSPASGYYDFQVSLWNDDNLGNEIGTCYEVSSPFTLTNRYVDDGVFQFHLLCGTGNNQMFYGSNRWVEVKVRPTGSGSFTTLPRQPIGAVPYAFSLRPAATVSSTIHSPSGVVNATNAGTGFGFYGYARASGAGVGGSATGSAIGLWGRSDVGSAVYGYSDRAAGTMGSSYDGPGVVGASAFGNPIEAYDLDAYPQPNRRFYVSNSGNAYADGAFVGGGADFAEMVPPAEEGLEPGDVLVISPDGTMERSSQAYQTSVAGIYSTDPGFVAGYQDDDDGNPVDPDRIPLAIVGIVPVKASAENGPIAPGDLLVASATPGHAMKTDEFVGGAVVGKALEPLAEGTGVIQILVMLQ